MNRLFLLLTLVLAIHTSWAQDTPRAKKCVAEVRKQYAAAKERNEREEKEEYAPKENMTVNLNYIIPGCGPTAETLHYLFTAKDGEEPGMRTYQPLLITRKYNVAARQMYEEYLFDGQTGEIIFTLFQHDNYNDGKDETRYYFDRDGKAWEIVKGERVMDDVFARRQAADLKAAANQLINRDY